MDSSLNFGSIGIAGPALRGPSSARLLAEPPLSPPVSAGAAPTASAQPLEPVSPLLAPLPPIESTVAATPVAEPTPRPATSLESLLMRFRLITSEQLDEALREKLETGKDVGAIVVERGWVNEDQLARLLSYAPAFNAPAESPAPERVEPEPAVESPAGPFAREALREPEPEPEREPEPEPEAEATPAPAPFETDVAPEREPEPQAEVAIPPALELDIVPEPPAPVFAEPTRPHAFELALPPALELVEPETVSEPEVVSAPEPLAATPQERAELLPLAPVAPEPEPVVAAPVVAAPAPEATVEPLVREPVVELAPAPVAAPAPQVVRFVEPAAIETIARVFVRFANGERVEAGSFDDMAAAKAKAEEIVRQIAGGAGGWPFFAGRYIRPDAIVSVDLDATVVRYA